MLSKIDFCTRFISCTNMYGMYEYHVKLCMYYVWSSHPLYSSVYINRLPTTSWSAEQGKRIFPCPRSRLRIWSRKTASAVLSRVSLIILHYHTQAESHACYTRNRVNPDCIGSRNCVPIALTAESPPAQSQYNSQGSSSNGCYL